MKYLQSSKNCPTCGIHIHETQPLLNLRPDRTLQDVVYKLVPELFESKSCLAVKRAVLENVFLTLCLLFLSADKLCKDFRP